MNKTIKKIIVSILIVMISVNYVFPSLIYAVYSEESIKDYAKNHIISEDIVRKYIKEINTIIGKKIQQHENVEDDMLVKEVWPNIEEELPSYYLAYKASDYVDKYTSISGVNSFIEEYKATVSECTVDLFYIDSITAERSQKRINTIVVRFI